MAIKKLYVGNLSYQITNEELKEHFNQAGNVVSAIVLVDKVTKQSRGFGFVEMEEEDAEKAISMFDGQDFAGRKLVVNEAKENKWEKK